MVEKKLGYHESWVVVPAVLALVVEVAAVKVVGYSAVHIADAVNVAAEGILVVRRGDVAAEQGAATSVLLETVHLSAA